MTIALAYLFAVTLASLALGLASAFRWRPDTKSASKPKPSRRPVAITPASRFKVSASLTSTLMRTERYGRVPVLPVEAEIVAMYGGDDIPMESLELPSRAPIGRVDDEIPW